MARNLVLHLLQSAADRKKRAERRSNSCCPLFLSVVRRALHGVGNDYPERTDAPKLRKWLTERRGQKEGAILVVHFFLSVVRRALHGVGNDCPERTSGSRELSLMLQNSENG